MDTTIAVSVISLLPLSWGPGGYLRTLSVLKKTGLNVQLLPLWGWKEDDYYRIPNNLVVSYEGSWISSTDFILKKILEGNLGAMAAPFMFGRISSSNRQIKWISERFLSAIPIDLPGGIEEVLSREKRELSYYFMNPGPFVFDTWHIRERVFDPEAINQVLEYLLSERKIKLFHLQTWSQQEFLDFLSGKETILGSAIQLFGRKKKEEIAIVIEVPPFFLWPKPVSILRKLKSQIESYLI